jgi:hypothetical protein
MAIVSEDEFAELRVNRRDGNKVFSLGRFDQVLNR